MILKKSVNHIIQRKLRIYFIALIFFASPLYIYAHPSVELAWNFFFKKKEQSDFKQYINSPLRQKLLSSSNSNLASPSKHDGSNWSGCQIGKGVLAGTFRDVSACAASACYGRDISIEEMKNLDYNAAVKIIEWIWNKIYGSSIPDQSVANLTMHIQMQFGNIRMVQNALNSKGYNLRSTGAMNRATLNALQNACDKDAIETYNIIREELLSTFKSMRGSHLYIRVVSKEFPPKTSLKKMYRDLIVGSFNGIKYFSSELVSKIELTRKKSYLI